MIDINTIIQQAFEKAINDAVDAKFEDMGMRIDAIVGRLNNLTTQMAENVTDLVRQINAVDDGLAERCSTMASANSVEHLERDVATLRRKVNELESDAGPSETDSDELASTIADLFANGDLTISIDKV